MDDDLISEIIHLANKIAVESYRAGKHEDTNWMAAEDAMTVRDTAMTDLKRLLENS